MTDKPCVEVHQKVLLRVEEAAALLSVNRDAVYRMVKAGILPTVTLNGIRRFPRRALDELAANYDSIPRCGRCLAELARIDTMVSGTKPTLLVGNKRTGKVLRRRPGERDTGSAVPADALRRDSDV